MSLYVAFEFDNNNLKIMEISKKGNLISVLKCITMTSLEIRDGKIEDIDSIVNLVNEELMKNNIGAKKAIFVINSSSVITRKIKLPILNKESDVLSMIKNEMELLISADLNRYKIIYKIIDEICDDVKSAFYVIYCLQEEIFNSYKILAKRLKLNLQFIDVSFNCLNKIYDNNIKINNSDSYMSSTEAFININKDYTTFSVINNGINDFSRMSFLEKEQIKIEFVAEPQAPYCFENNSYNTYFMNNLIEEISKYIRYYCSIDYTNNIHKIYIYGDSCVDANLCKYLSTQLKIQVELISDISNITVEYSSCLNNVSNKYFILCLVLFADRKDINFSVKRNILENFKARVIAVGCVLLIIAVTVFTFIGSDFLLENEMKKMSIFIKDEDNIKLNSEIEELKREVHLLEEYLCKVKKLNNVIYKDNYISSVILREVYYVIPENTKVTSMVVDRNSTQLSCISLYITDVTVFLNDLRNLDFIESIHTPSIEMIKGANYPYSYSIIFTVNEVNI